MRTPHESSVGQIGFVANHGLWTDEQQQAARELEERLKTQDVRRVRIAWCDQHGIARGKTLTTPDFLLSLRNGQDFQLATLIMDTTNNVVTPLFSAEGAYGVEEMRGFPDGILVPDPTTFRTLPWSPGTGWVLSDMYFQSGRPVPFCSRQLLKGALATLADRGFDYMAGLEVEFYITKLEDKKLTPEQSGWPPDAPTVSTVAHGFQYLTEIRNDEIDDILVLLQDHLTEIGLPLRSMEDEWGPGQSEFTFDPQLGLEPADTMLLFRTATKQICRRQGLHATFMTKPALPNFFSSGWHLHQSLVARDGERNAFTNRDDDGAPLSELGRYFTGGILEHAAAGSVFSTPTVNGYKRFAPFSFAPDRASWAVENRGAMIRVVGGPNDESTHLENRAGEPCANPYLFMASQIVAGLDGVDRKLDPGSPDLEPYAADRRLLPAGLDDAVAALDEQGQVFRDAFGSPFVEFMLSIKRHELGRYRAHVTDWEQREYFEVY
jgi:glutamine synthetase